MNCNMTLINNLKDIDHPMNSTSDHYEHIDNEWFKKHNIGKLAVVSKRNSEFFIG